MQDSDDTLISAVGFVCRNSLSSPARDELIAQMVRSHAARDYVHISKSADRHKLIAEKVGALTKQLQKRQYL